LLLPLYIIIRKFINLSFLSFDNTNEFIRRGELDKAEKYLKEGHHLAKEANTVEIIAISFYNYYLLKREKGQYKESLEYFEELIVLKDSILGIQRNQTIEDVETKYRTEQVQDSLNYQTQVVSYQKKQTRNISIGLVSAILALLIIGVLYTRIQKQKVEIQRQKGISDVLFDDLRHRVGNNIQTITRLLTRQERMTDNVILKEALNEIQQRMNTVVGMYNKLSYSDEVSGTVVNMKDYLKEIINSIVQTASLDNSIEVNTDIDAVYSTKEAPFVALIVNEVVTNAIKHNENKSDLSISVKLNEENGKHKLTIKDNGIGLPTDFEIDTKKSLGMSIINSLSKNIKADYQFYNDNGACFELTF
jgi:two-component sensor histidine kinase